MPATNLEPHFLIDLAVVVHKHDNVAVASHEIAAGTALILPSGEVVELLEDLAPGHRLALKNIPAGTYVLQYGHPIGTSMGIHAGEVVSVRNMNDYVPVVRDIPPDLYNPEPEYFAAGEIPTFLGFRRPDGRTGTRNFVLIVPTSMCASHEAQQNAMIAGAIPM